MSKLVSELSIGSLNGAIAIFDKLARDMIHLEHEDAKCEATIADVKARHEKNTAELRVDVALAAERLTAYIATHPATFEDPRKVKTAFGSFGLRKISELRIDDESRCVAWLVNNGIADCIKTVVKPVKAAIRKAIEERTIRTPPGCQVLEGDAPVYEVEKSLLDAARRTGAAK